MKQINNSICKFVITIQEIFINLILIEHLEEIDWI